MAIYGYIRVSTDKQQHSLEWQKGLIEQWAKRNKADITDDRIFVDADVSGSIPFHLRPAGKQLIQIAAAGDVIVTYHVDRISRSLNDFASLLQHLSNSGIRLQILEFGDHCFNTDNIYERFHLHVLGAISELQLYMIRSRVKEGLRAAIQRGEITTTPYAIKRTVIRSNNNKKKVTRFYWTKDLTQRFVADIICYGAFKGYPPYVVVNEIRRVNACRRYRIFLEGIKLSTKTVVRLWSYYRRWPKLVAQAVKEYEEKIKLSQEEIANLTKKEYLGEGFSGYGGHLAPQKSKASKRTKFWKKNADIPNCDMFWTMPEVVEKT